MHSLHSRLKATPAPGLCCFQLSVVLAQASTALVCRFQSLLRRKSNSSYALFQPREMYKIRGFLMSFLGLSRCFLGRILGLVSCSALSTFGFVRILSGSVSRVVSYLVAHIFRFSTHLVLSRPLSESSVSFTSSDMKDQTFETCLALKTEPNPSPVHFFLTMLVSAKLMRTQI